MKTQINRPTGSGANRIAKSANKTRINGQTLIFSFKDGAIFNVVRILAVFKGAKKVLVASDFAFDVGPRSTHGSNKRKRSSAIPIHAVLKI